MKFVLIFFICALSIFAEGAQSDLNEEFFGKDAAVQEEKAKALEAEAMALYDSKKFAEAAAKMYSADLLNMLAKHASGISAAMKAYIFSDAKLTEDISLAIKPQDNLDKVFGILSAIWDSSPDNFKQFPRLAAAIAVVFDTPPPKTWPHHQVSEKALPRQLPDPVKAFDMWTSFRKKNRLLIQPEKLSIEELKYVVSSLGTEADKEYAQKSVSTNLSGIGKLYSSIEYDNPRLKGEVFDWPTDDYSLQNIKRLGGICVDQAYYTTEVAKARGVPSFILSGAGADGFHAWVAYMVRPGNWNFDVGRYEGARFVTGTTFDPQTWQRATDHDLEMLRENFRSNPRYTANAIHTYFAKKFLDAEDFAKATAAAEAAIKIDARNSDSWDILIEAAKESGKSGKQIEEIYARAIKAFSKSPDLDAAYRKTLIDMLLESGDKSGARKLSTSIILKTRQNRPDIAMQFAMRDIYSDLENDDMKDLYSSYKDTLSAFKKDTAIAFKGITIPVLNEVFKKGKKKECLEIIEITRKILKGDETFTSNIDSVEADIKKAL